MKYLKYLVVTVVVLTLLFLGKGLLTPSLSYSSEITVNKSIKEAWAVMNDESKISEWLKGIKKVEHVSGEKGTVGAVTKYTFEEDGKESIIFETIKSIQPNEHISMEFLMEDVMTMDYQTNFTEKDGKTHIKSSTVTKGVNMFTRSMVSFMKSSMQAQEDENMSNLKKLIDENTTNYFPSPVEEMTDEIVEEVQEE